jgi:hypothetical protein
MKQAKNSLSWHLGCPNPLATFSCHFLLVINPVNLPPPPLATKLSIRICTRQSCWDQFEILKSHISYFSFIYIENFWRTGQQQKMMQENSKNWENHVSYWNDIFFGRSYLIHVMQSGTP